MTNQLPACPHPSRLLTAVEYQRLADVTPEIEWFANLGNQATRRVYENALKDLCSSPASVDESNNVAAASAEVPVAWR